MFARCNALELSTLFSSYHTLPKKRVSLACNITVRMGIVIAVYSTFLCKLTNPRDPHDLTSLIHYVYFRSGPLLLTARWRMLRFGRGLCSLSLSWFSGVRRRPYIHHLPRVEAILYIMHHCCTWT